MVIGRMGVVMCALAALGTSCRGLSGSGVTRTETRTMAKTPSCIEVHGAVDLDVAVSERPASLTVRGDDNLLTHLKTGVSGPCLQIGPDTEISPRAGLQVDVRLPSLEHLTASGAGKLKITGLHGAAFGLHASGATSADLAGEVTQLTVDVSGVAGVNAQGLKAHEARIQLSGAGSVAVFADQAVAARISGAGKVEVWGKPAKIDKTISGVGVFVAR